VPPAVQNAVILIPTYNSALFLSETLDSIENQCGHRDLAIRIADDASTDDTVTLAARRRNTCRISISVSSRNRGERRNVSEAMHGLAADGAEWVLLLHSDDLAKPSWLSTMLSRINACDEQVATICSSWDDLYPDGRLVPGEDNLTREVERISGDLESTRGTLQRGCWWHISGCAIRTRAFQEIGDFDPDMPQLGDLEWLLRCLRSGWAVEYIPRTLILYRQHPQSVSATSFSVSADIVESLTLARKHADIMSARQVLSFHIKRAKYVVLRTGRAFTQHRFSPGVTGLKLIGRVTVNAVNCLQKASG
jgi:glycosyltransferase involved in cell wall biosynthesis